MYREFVVMLGLTLGGFLLFLLSLVPSSLFLNVIETRVYTSGIVELYRKPLHNGIVLKYTEEVTTLDGRNCTGISGSATYGNLGSNRITYIVHKHLLQCLQEGAVHRVSRQYLFFRPILTETIVEEG
jgi:hypothetical protein